MSTYDIVLCGDGYYRRIVYGLGPYIANYPKQVLLACTVQGWCPRLAAATLPTPISVQLMLTGQMHGRPERPGHRTGTTTLS